MDERDFVGKENRAVLNGILWILRTVHRGRTCQALTVPPDVANSSSDRTRASHPVPNSIPRERRAHLRIVYGRRRGRARPVTRSPRAVGERDKRRRELPGRQHICDGQQRRGARQSSTIHFELSFDDVSILRFGSEQRFRDSSRAQPRLFPAHPS